MSAQSHLEGMEPPHHEDVTKAAQAYVKARDERMKLTDTEVERKARLLEKMQAHDLKVYEDEDANVRVEVTQGEIKVKVKRLVDEE